MKTIQMVSTVHFSLNAVFLKMAPTMKMLGRTYICTEDGSGDEPFFSPPRGPDLSGSTSSHVLSMTSRNT